MRKALLLMAAIGPILGVIFCVFPGVLMPPAEAKKKDITQVLELPKDPPQAVAAETRNLIFHVAPLTTKGLLSQQIRDGLKALLKANSGDTVVKIRAFVSGTGDMRRVPALVSEIMTDKHLALPAVSVIQVGGLPLEGAQVSLESISVSRKETNPGGILLIGGQEASTPKPFESTLPLAEAALAKLDAVLAGTQALRVTCFTTSLADAPRLQTQVTARYPQAAVSIVVLQRAASRSTVSCEAASRLPDHDFKLNGNEATAVLSPRIAFTGTQVAFGFEDNDARLAFKRLDKALEPLGASTKTVALANFYPLSNSIARQIDKIRLEFFNPRELPPSTNLPFEGLPSIDASFAVEVAAAISGRTP